MFLFGFYKLTPVILALIAVDSINLVDLQGIPGLGVMSGAMIYAFRIAMRANRAEADSIQRTNERLLDENERLHKRIDSLGQNIDRLKGLPYKESETEEK